MADGAHLPEIPALPPMTADAFRLELARALARAEARAHHAADPSTRAQERQESQEA